MLKCITNGDKIKWLDKTELASLSDSYNLQRVEKNILKIMNRARIRYLKSLCCM